MAMPSLCSTLRPGLVNLPNSAAASSTLLELLQRDVEQHHCFFNDFGFHNHLPHHLVAAYDMGATPALLRAIWDDEVTILRPIGRCGTDVEVGNWTERLGEHGAYGSYLAFFESQVVEHGPEKTILDYIMAPKANGNEAKMFARFLSGGRVSFCSSSPAYPTNSVHPLLQIGFGLEFGQNNMIAAGLAMTAVTSSRQPAFVLDSASGLPEPTAAPIQGMTLLQLLQEVYDSEVLHPVMPYDPNATITQRFEAFAADPARAEEIKRIYSKWWLSPDATQEEINHKMKECLLQSTLLLVSSGKPERTPRLDFFLMHFVTSAICLPSIVRMLPSVEAKNALLQGWVRAAALYLVLRGRPRVDAGLVMGFPEVPTPPGLTSLGPDALGYKSKDVVVANPWLVVIQNGLHHRDAHVIKTIRSFYYGAEHMPVLGTGTGGRGLGLEHIKGGERVDDSLWIRAAGIWQWTIGGDAGGGAEFSILANAAAPGMAAFYDVATAGLGATYQQLTMVDPSTVNFGIAANCVNETSGSFFLSFEGNGYVLTSWAAQDGDTAAPVTLESYTGRAEQVWTSIPA
ncbi:hypothetical protein HMN09_00472600 [Mycena chlorophos]|uniref:Uncharacterized protein n=1 Tax=Mycena chlorophos TaxID=658473 RepID=A0A8H6TGQ0_MYCCL|nr:hypothetical protein HMN09_00472600 [Mycena chlorophos]